MIAANINDILQRIQKNRKRKKYIHTWHTVTLYNENKTAELTRRVRIA